MMKTNYLKEFMNSIPTGEYKDVKDRIIKKCHITDDIWSNWLSGRTSIPELAKPIISEIVNRDVFAIENTTPVTVHGS